MKILIITNYLGEKSGWGSYSLSLIEQLIKNRFEVVVVCNKKNEKYGKIKQIEILPNPLSFKKNYFFAPLYVLKMLLNFKKMKKIDLVHCFVEPYAFIAYLSSKVLNVKYFITIHGSYGVKTLRNVFYRFFQMTAYENAQKVICVSNYTKKRVLEYKNLTNFLIISNGVNRGKVGCPTPNQKENIILGVGALKKRKGFDVIIKAMKIVVKMIYDAKYYIVGPQSDSDYTNYLKRLIKDSDLENNVVLLGGVSDDKLRELYQKAKIFALTPLSDKYNFEGFGLVYLEANTYGLPVIGSYENGGEDAIKDRYNGFLAKANDPEDTAEKIIKLLNNQELYEKMSQNATDWSRKMSWDNIIKKYLEVYEYKKR